MNVILRDIHTSIFLQINSMGNFISKEELLLEIGTTFSKIENGKLSLEDLERLVTSTRELYERSVVLKYKSMEEKVFGITKPIEEPVVVNDIEEDVEVEEIEIEEETIVEEPIPFSLSEVQNETILDSVKSEKIIEELTFGFSLFDYEDEQEDVAENITLEEDLELTDQEEIISQTEFEVAGVSENITVQEEEYTSEEFVNDSEPILSEDFFSSNDTFQGEIVVEEKIEEQIEEFEEEELVEEIVGQPSSFSYGELAPFINKFNLVESNVSTQFGIAKIDTLIGSFGLNERLQYINELFDGSSEDFSDAVKILDNQPSIEIAKTKVAEIALINQWEVDSETIIEFIQKVVRRYVL